MKNRYLKAATNNNDKDLEAAVIVKIKTDPISRIHYADTTSTLLHSLLLKEKGFGKNSDRMLDENR